MVLLYTPFTPETKSLLAMYDFLQPLPLRFEVSSCWRLFPWIEMHVAFDDAVDLSRAGLSLWQWLEHQVLVLSKSFPLAPLKCATSFECVLRIVFCVFFPREARHGKVPLPCSGDGSCRMRAPPCTLCAQKRSHRAKLLRSVRTALCQDSGSGNS